MSGERSTGEHPHSGQPIFREGTDLSKSRAALILIHGRGSNAADILGLAGELELENIAFLAPQAKNGVWYPFPYHYPVEQNEPWLSSALRVVGELVQEAEREGIPAEQVGLLGFSQGACLVLEYAARNPRRYGGIFALSGVLIGEAGKPRTVQNKLDGTPVFFGCSDIDPYFTVQQIENDARLFQQMGATVEKRIYPGMPHTVNYDEIRYVQQVMQPLTEPIE